MVSLSGPVRRMRFNASSTVMVSFRSTNSVVMMLPVESSGYFKISLMLLRISGSECCKMRFTTPAGISSTMSTASSRYSSSSTSFSSVLENPRISSSCSSLSSSTNTSAASSLGSRRNTRMGARSSNSSHSHAMSAASRGSRRSRSSAYRFLDTRSSTCSASSSHLFSDSDTPRDLLSNDSGS